MSYKDFVHLHVKSEYSFLESLLRIPQIVGAAKANGMQAVALTDCNNLHGFLEFSQAIKQGLGQSNASLKPIFGAELSLSIETDDKTSCSSHSLTLLCRDSQGYKNLRTLVSLAHLHSKPGSPQVSKGILSRYSAGLIALSGGPDGEIPTLVASGDIARARNVAESYAEIFGPENFYIELCVSGIKERQYQNGRLIDLARIVSQSVVATGQCRYLYPEHHWMLDVARRIVMETSFVRSTQSLSELSADFTFQSYTQISKLFSGCEDALDNTLRIAEKCSDVVCSPSRPELAARGLEQENFDIHLKSLAEAGLQLRIAKKAFSENKQRAYRKRLAQELDVLSGQGLSGEFLFLVHLADTVVSENSTVGPGIGTLPSSLVAYAIGLTQVDPILTNLVFERFLIEGSQVPPYLALHCGGSEVESLIRAADTIVGSQEEERVRLASGPVFLSLRGAQLKRKLKEVFNVSGDELNLKLSDSSTKKHYEQESLAKISVALPVLEGLKTGVCAGMRGVFPDAPRSLAIPLVRTGRPLIEFVPLGRTPQGEIISQFSTSRLAEFGLRHIPVLLLDERLSSLQRAEHSVESIQKKMIDWDTVSIDDQETYGFILRGDTTGICFLENLPWERYLRLVKPRNFEELTAFVTTRIRCETNHNLLLIERLLRSLNIQQSPDFQNATASRILKPTYGLLLYHEQAIHLLQEIGRISPALAEELLHDLGSGRGPNSNLLKTMQAQWRIADPAQRIFQLILSSLPNLSPKSHMASQALIAFRLAYIKAHYPEAYNLSSVQ